MHEHVPHANMGQARVTSSDCTCAVNVVESLIELIASLHPGPKARKCEADLASQPRWLRLRRHFRLAVVLIRGTGDCCLNDEAPLAFTVTSDQADVPACGSHRALFAYISPQILLPVPAAAIIPRSMVQAACYQRSIRL